MNSPYSILVLRGTQVHRFVVSKKGLRQLLLAGITVVFASGVFFSDYLEAERRKVDDVIANGQAQKEKLTVLRNRAQEVQKTLAQWKGLRERIQASLPRQSEPTLETQYEGEELQQFLAVLQGELKQMIASVPSEWPVNGAVVSGVGMRPSPGRARWSTMPGWIFPSRWELRSRRPETRLWSPSTASSAK